MNRFFAMDTNFYHSLGSYEFDVRCEMLAELGYDGTYLTLRNERAWQDLPALADVRRRHGLDVAGVYLMIDLADGSRDRLVTLIETLEGASAIELAVKCSGAEDRAADRALHELLDAVLPRSQRRGIDLLLYPHVGFYIERIERAVDLCAAVAHPSLGLVFAGYHWYAVDGTNLPQHLHDARSYLRSVNICGSRRNPPGANMPCSIECLDEGELDNFAVLGQLRTIGYDGWIGLQGFANGGDVYLKLRRSLEAYRDMNRRLQAHPHWARLR